MCKSQFFILPNFPEKLKPRCFFDGEICDQDFGFCKNCSRKQTLLAKKVEWEKETWDGEHYITYPVCPTCGEMVGGTKCDGCGQARGEIMWIIMMDDLGRIRIPKELRQKLNIDAYDYFQIEVEDGKIVLTKVPDYKKGEEK